jgi:hypothetical protein
MIACDIDAVAQGSFERVHAHFEALWSALFPGELPPYSEGFRHMKVAASSKSFAESDVQFPERTKKNESGDPVLLDNGGRQINLASTDLLNIVILPAKANPGFDIAIFDELVEATPNEVTPRSKEHESTSKETASEKPRRHRYMVRALQVKYSAKGDGFLKKDLLDAKATTLTNFNAQPEGAVIKSLKIDYATDFHFIVVAFRKASEDVLKELRRGGLTVLAFEDVLKLYSPSLAGLAIFGKCSYSHMYKVVYCTLFCPSKQIPIKTEDERHDE